MPFDEQRLIMVCLFAVRFNKCIAYVSSVSSS